MTSPFDPRDDRDATLAALLRAEVAPPADMDWEALERRVLAAIASERGGTTVLPLFTPDAAPWLARWTRASLVAAAVSALVAGLAEQHRRSLEAQAAFEALMESQQVVVQSGLRPAGDGAREATLRYVVGP